MTDYSYGARRKSVSAGARDKPYTYRPSHSPPRTEIKNTAAMQGRDEGQARKAGNKAIITSSILLLAAAAIAVVLFGFFSSYFEIKSINVSGLAEHSSDEIIAATGICMGDKLYSVDAEKAEKRILAAYPDIAKVSIEKVLPAEINIILTYEIPRYFISVTGEYFTLSESLRVLERSSDRKALESLGLIYVEMPNIKRSVTGEKLEFFDGDGEYIEEFLNIFSGSSFAEDVDRIYIEAKFDISLVKVGKYRIDLGDWKDEALKLKMAEKVLDAGGYRELEGVVLDVSNVAESSAMVHKTLKIE